MRSGCDRQLRSTGDTSIVLPVALPCASRPPWIAGPCSERYLAVGGRLGWVSSGVVTVCYVCAGMGYGVLVILVKKEYDIPACLSVFSAMCHLLCVPSLSPRLSIRGAAVRVVAHAKMSGSSFWGTVVKPGKTGTPLRTKASQLTMVLKQVRPPSLTGHPCRVPCSSRFVHLCRQHSCLRASPTASPACCQYR